MGCRLSGQEALAGLIASFEPRPSEAAAPRTVPGTPRPAHEPEDVDCVKSLHIKGNAGKWPAAKFAAAEDQPCRFDAAECWKPCSEHPDRLAAWPCLHRSAFQLLKSGRRQEKLTHFSGKLHLASNAIMLLQEVYRNHLLLGSSFDFWTLAARAPASPRW